MTSMDNIGVLKLASLLCPQPRHLLRSSPAPSLGPGQGLCCRHKQKACQSIVSTKAGPQQLQKPQLVAETASCCKRRPSAPGPLPCPSSLWPVLLAQLLPAQQARQLPPARTRPLRRLGFWQTGRRKTPFGPNTKDPRDQ